jgi:hypothetical protein
MTQRRVSVRASVRQERNKKGQGKGWRGTWRDRLEIPKTLMPKEGGFLLTAGEYPDRRKESQVTGEQPPILPYHARHIHTMTTVKGKYFKHTCQVYHDGGSCLSCEEFARGNKKVDGNRKQKSAPRSMYSINAIEFNLFAEEPIKDKDGRVVRHDEDHPQGLYKRGDPRMRWEVIASMKDRRAILQNKSGLAEDVADGAIRLWRKSFLEVGSGHLACIDTIAQKAAEFCKCGGNLERVGFRCSNDDCGHVFADLREDDIGADLLEKFDTQREVCPNCGNDDYPVPIHECDSCDQPEPYEWDEVIVWAHKSGEGAQTTIIIDRVEPVDSYRLPDGSAIVELDKDGVAKIDDDGKFIFGEEIKKLVTNQFNFDQIHEPPDREMIAENLGIREPAVSKVVGSRRRSSDDDEEEEETPTPRSGGARRGGKSEPTRSPVSRRR